MKKDLALEKIWSQVPVDYYQSGVSRNFFQKYWHTQKLKTLQQLTKHKEFARILDAGCASGYMTKQISRIFPKSEIFGTDIYSDAIAYARKQYPKIKFVAGDLHKTPFTSNFFDLVICYETIEHVLKPQQVLKEFRRITKPRGTIILAMDSGTFLFKLIWFFWGKTKGKVWAGAHLHPFKHTELEGLIKKVGFTVEKKYFSHFGLEVIFVLQKSQNFN